MKTVHIFVLTPDLDLLDIKVEIMSSKPTPKQYKIIGSLSEIQNFLLYGPLPLGGWRIQTGSP